MQSAELKIALQNADSLLASDAELALSEAQKLLNSFPNDPNALRILAVAQRKRHLLEESADTLDKLVAIAPDFALAHEERGLTMMALGKGAGAEAAFRKSVQLNDKLGKSWRALGDLLTVQGNESEAEQCYQQHLACTAGSKELVAAANYLYAGKLAKCEEIVRKYLYDHPTNVSAIRMLAEVGLKVGQYGDAEKLLQRCLDLAPDFHSARSTYAQVLFKKQQYHPALAELDTLLEAEPDNPNHHILKASVLVRIGNYLQAIEIYEWVLDRFPGQAKIHLSHGHALKTVGRQEEAIKAYRKCIELKPHLGEAYWSLANLKMFSFDEQDLAQMKSATDVSEIDRQDFFHLCFALGKALEDEEQFDDSFYYYRLGNKARREVVQWDADENQRSKEKQQQYFTADYFNGRADAGDSSPDPIFIVGLPRAGSTLLEQILASHSQVEGTMELPDILSIARRLNGKSKPEDPGLYPEVLDTLNDQQLTELGKEYLDRTRIQRIAGTPYFIDKMPNNFAHVGLIHLILPNSKIIDARRHPLGCCFSGFKQLFASGQNYTYNLREIGRYYRDYAELMDHWAKVLPGRVLRVHYEQVIADFETQVRRLLDYCELPFEEACLEYHKTDRAVRTASSEQVRQPIYQSGVAQWQNFETHLETLKEALGNSLDDYPQTP